MPMTMSGNGSISGLTPGGLPDGAVQQADLAAGVAGNGPAFSAYQSAAQSLVQNVTTKLQFQTEEYDTASAFDNSVNYRFQPAVAGYYQVSGALHVASAYANILLYIYKNGALYKLAGYTIASAAAHFSTLVYLNGTTDYLELFVNQSAATQNSANGQQTYFQAFLARAA